MNMVGVVRFPDPASGLLSHSQRASSCPKPPVTWSGVVEVGTREALKGLVNQIMAQVDGKLSVLLIRRSSFEVKMQRLLHWKQLDSSGAPDSLLISLK